MKTLLLLMFSFCQFILTGQSYKELLIEYQKGEFEYVIEKGVPLCKENYKDIDLKLLVGRAYTDNLQYKEAIPFLNYVDQNAKKKGWRRGWCEIYLGISNFGLGKYEWSRTYLNRAGSAGSTDNIRRYADRQLILLGFVKSYNEFRLKNTESILFHFHPDLSDDLDAINTYISHKEEAFAEAHDFFNCSVPKQIDLFVWNTEEEMKKVLDVKTDGVAKPEMCLIHSNIKRTSNQEIALVISHYIDAVGKKSAIINFGTATLLANSEKDVFEEAKNLVTEVGLNRVSVADIWAVNRYDSELYNMVSAAFVKYLIEKEGKEKFMMLFKDQTYYNAKKIYGDNIVTLIVDFEKEFSKS